MALDILPVTSSMGGNDRVFSFKLDSGGGTFERGQVVAVDAAVGDVEEVAAGLLTLDETIHYLALEGATEAQNVTNRGGSSTITATGPPTGEPLIACVPLAQAGQEFVTRHVFAGSDTDIGPAGSGASTGVLVGAVVGIRVTAGGIHGIDTTGAGFVITRALNDLGQDNLLYGGTLTNIDKVFFRPDSTVT